MTLSSTHLRSLLLVLATLSMATGALAMAQPPGISPTTDAPAALSGAPVARSNWAVARAGGRVFAFYGLGPGKTARDIASDVHELDVHGNWKNVGNIPVRQGRLASAAVTVAGNIYVIGGYTVSPTGAEASTPEILRFDPQRNRFAIETRMPVPVDDTVAMPWRDRWIVLVSGWHDTGNVDDVQIYDTQARRWVSGTAWPGVPVFGHAGGLVGDSMVICDGVTATRGDDGKHRFAISDACWLGALDPEAVGTIRWTRLPAHPGVPLYRAGAVGSVAPDGSAKVIFAGGSHRPYNYNGIGYDGLPAEPSDAVFAFRLAQNGWQEYAPLPEAGMDFRGLLEIDGNFVLVGGMRAGQQVSGGLIRFQLKPPRALGRGTRSN